MCIRDRYYSDRLLEFPLGMFGVAIGTVILPHLSGRHSATDPLGYSKGLDWGFRLCLMIGIPSCIGLILCAEPVSYTHLDVYKRQADIIAELGWTQPWYMTSAVSREGTWPIMKDVMAFFDRLKEDEQEARDAG